MSKLALARAEAARLYEADGLDIPEIARRMGRSDEGVELLLKYGGVAMRVAAPPPGCRGGAGV